MTLGSLFDGIGGFPYAGSFFGIKPRWASEILPQAVAVTKRHFPDMEHVGDVTTLDGAILTPVNIITFGSPCQDLSTAGKRAGIDGERSSLFYEAIRIIDEMREATNGKYPQYAIWENVPGALSSGKPRGSDFRAVIEAFTKTKVPAPGSGHWSNAGMVRSDSVNLAWRILNAQFFGVPQRRRRIFLVASFGAGCPGEILFVEKSLPGHFAPCSQKRKGVAADAEGSAGGTVCLAHDSDNAGTLVFAANQRDEVRDLGAASGASQAQPGMKQQTFIAQKCPASWDDKNHAVHCLNPWDAQQSRIFTVDGASPTLAGADGGGGRNPAGLVIHSESNVEQKPVAAFLGGASANARSIGYSEEVSPTLKSATCGFSAPCLCEPQKSLKSPIVFGLSSDGSGAMHSSNPASGVYEATTSRTLDQNGSSPACNQGGMLIIESAPVLNDQGGSRISVESSDTSPTLRSQTHGHLPIVAARYAAVVGVHQSQSGEVNISETAYTLATTSNASSRNAPLVAHVNHTDCMCAEHFDVIVHPNVAGTLCASGAGLSRPGGMASEADLCVAYERPTYALQGAMIKRQDRCDSVIPINTQIATRHMALGEKTGFGVRQEGDPAYTVKSSSSHAIAIGKCRTVFNCHGSGENIACTQTARQNKNATDIVCEVYPSEKAVPEVSAVDCRNYKEVGDLSGTLQSKNKPGYSLNYQNPVRVKAQGARYIVRRLTPTECERLQGFPDGWTKYGHDGKEISDTRRYMILGNSIAVPCLIHIFKGIMAVSGSH